MKHSLLALMLLAGSSLTCEAIAGHKSSEKSCATCEPTLISKPGKISTSGVFCLTNDIVGSITIESDNVVLDLNGHQVNGNASPYAIYTRGFNNVSVKNGAVINQGNLAIGAVNANGFTLENIEVYESAEALLLANSNDCEVTSLFAYNNVNNIGAIVAVDNCNTVRLTDVQASNNTKSLDILAGNSDIAIGIVTINNSANIVLTDCSANSNTQTNDNARFSPFAALFCKNVSFIRCQANLNAIPTNVVNTLGFAPFFIRTCSDTVLDGCQANGNSMGTTRLWLRPIFVAGSFNNVITNCQVNDNSVGTLYFLSGTQDLTGIHLFANSGFGTESNNVISHCQVCNNVVSDGGSGRTSRTSSGLVAGIAVEGTGGVAGFEDRTTVTDCQVDGNKILTTSAAFQPVVGIFIKSARDVVVSHCTSDGNSGGSASYGMVLQNALSCHIESCQANKNGTDGFFAGPVTTNTPTNSEITILHSLAKENGLNGFEVSGIGTNDDFLIEGNIAMKNGSGGFVDASSIAIYTRTTRYISNYSAFHIHAAIPLDRNYQITNGAIQLFSLDPFGVYANVSGTNTLTSLTNIELIPSLN